MEVEKQALTKILLEVAEAGRSLKREKMKMDLQDPLAAQRYASLLRDLEGNLALIAQELNQAEASLLEEALRIEGNGKEQEQEQEQEQEERAEGRLKGKEKRERVGEEGKVEDGGRGGEKGEEVEREENQKDPEQEKGAKGKESLGESAIEEDIEEREDEESDETEEIFTLDEGDREEGEGKGKEKKDKRIRRKGNGKGKGKVVLSNRATVLLGNLTQVLISLKGERELLTQHLSTLSPGERDKMVDELRKQKPDRYRPVSFQSTASSSGFHSPVSLSRNSSKSSRLGASSSRPQDSEKVAPPLLFPLSPRIF